MDKDEELKRLRKENDTLRALLGNSAKPCVYCGLAAEDQAKCPSGFPGCSRADDQMLSEHFAAGYAAEQSEKEARAYRLLLEDLIARHSQNPNFQLREHLPRIAAVLRNQAFELGLINKTDNLV